TVREARSVKNSKGGTRVGGVFNASQFFIGVNSSLAVRKRYKDLLKIFHPDNLCGDESIVKAINEEYEKLRIEFNG
ncbi:MAG: J domain-containing protein, partial [Lachnospiraceae bacterium]|nr:J domain-containing protein [Lachnospiraceae bacterium]